MTRVSDLDNNFLDLDLSSEKKKKPDMNPEPTVNKGGSTFYINNRILRDLDSKHWIYQR